MTIKEQVAGDLLKAMKEKDVLGLNTLRMLKSAIKYLEVEKKKDASDEDAISVVGREIKKRKESARLYGEAGKDELAKKELAEAEVLMKYMPEQLTEDELETIIHKVIEETGANDMQAVGRVIGAVMGRVKGKAEGGMVKELVQKCLSK